MQNVSIREAAPQIFRRPLLYVGPNDSIVHAATFLAIGPQIYADGLVVLDAGRLAGRIGGRQLVRHILEKKDRWLDAQADTVTEYLDKSLDADAPLKDALDIFAKTHFAFVPVSTEGLVVASLSVRDLLGIVDNGRKIGELASPLEAVQEKMSVTESLEFMVEKGIRDLVTLRQDGPYVINDRRVLEFLLGHEARQLVLEKGFSALDSVLLSYIGFSKGKTIGPDESVSEAARILSDIGTPCAFVGNRILTPWDIVMK
jgi:CBS domain-containing protein